MIFLVLAALSAIGIWIVSLRLSGGPSSQHATVMLATIRATDEDRRVSGAALGALRAVRAATEREIGVGDYATRVREAKAQVDRVIARPDGRLALKQALLEAVELYRFAHRAWQARLSQDYRQITTDPAIGLCGPVRDGLAAVEASAGASPEAARGAFLADNVPAIWACGAERLAQLEQHLRPS